MREEVSRGDAQKTSGSRRGTLATEDTEDAEGGGVIWSSPEFNLTHEKSMIIDGNTAYITGINLASSENASTKRDVGVILFETDWDAAEELPSSRTPPSCP